MRSSQRLPAPRVLEWWSLEMRAQVVQEASRSRSLVPRGAPAQQRVERIGRQIAKIASDGTSGGGYQEHMKACTRSILALSPASAPDTSNWT